jgi:UDP-GlcNAc:undecaprenyl-phosphate/decaprenyl-phosphate GlcNAc-1-phosphate transferase
MTAETEWLAGVGLGLTALSFAISVSLCGVIRRLAPRLGFLDRPGGHKGHRAPVPLGGGVAIWAATIAVPLLGIALAVIARGWLPVEVARHLDGVLSRSRELALILGLATLIMLLGLMDDRKALGWKPRLVVQIGLAALLAWNGVRVTLFGPFTAPAFGGIVTVLWVVGLTNAFNFLDNMDGLAAGVGWIAAGLFIGAQVAAGSLFVPGVLCGLVGALLGFLVHNRAPARLYMGDAGSNFLGFLLGAATVAGTYYRYGEGQSKLGVLAPLLVMAVPLYDAASVVVLRLRAGRSPFEGDRRHFSHRLVDRGLTPPQAVRTINLVTLAGGLGALLLHRLSAVGGAVVVAQTLSLLGVVATLEVSTGRKSDRERGVGDVEATAPKP